MGAPKQRWTPEEEAALKAGINKYGVGKWSTILKDSEFNTTLQSRSNVDLKDKWRNMSFMANGLGSRRANVALRNSQVVLKHHECTSWDSLGVEKDPVVLDAKHLSEVYVTVEDTDSENQVSRVDDLIFEAIEKLKKPRGSSRHSIAEYILDHHSVKPDIERTLAANLKAMTEDRRLVKVKHLYKIAPRPISMDVGPNPALVQANAAKEYTEGQGNGIIILTKAEIETELEMVRSMTAEEAATFAAQAVAEAEAAIEAAEAAALEAEEAEMEAEAAHRLADAARKALTHSASFRGTNIKFRV